MDHVLKEYFGFSCLRPYQRDVVSQVLNGRYCLVVMATGAGKSICYQLPPLVTRKTAIVISPLLSLMQDQVMSLQQKGVRSYYLGSTQKNPDVIHHAQSRMYDVLYLTPERAISFPDNIFRAGICLLAVDEVHCISEWGHAFRLDYKKINLLRDYLPGIPFIALTATATEWLVREDIKQSLFLHDPFVYIGSFDRPNLFYGVKLIKHGARSTSSIMELLKDVPRRALARESTIIYCATIRDTEQVHSVLSSQGIPSAIYHGQLSSSDREQAHKSFVTDQVFVMVATIAFGMGIEKPDVRCVIHYGCPKSLESYYQESGRCGRDGLQSVCWLYFSRSDFNRGDFYCADIKSEEQKTAIMNSFLAGQRHCVLGTCHRQNLLNYFGEPSPDSCGNCDNCTSRVSKENDVSNEAALMLGCVQECGGRWGLNLPVNCKKVISNNMHKSSFHGLGINHEPNWWKGLGGILLAEGFLSETVNGCYRFISISDKGKEFLDAYYICPQPLVLKMTPEMCSDNEDSSGSDEESSVEQFFLCNEEIVLYQMLEFRKKVAEDNDVAPYAICSDQVLRNLAKTRPSNEENLSLVDGVNLNFVTRFGDILIHSVKDMAQEIKLGLDNMDSEAFPFDEIEPNLAYHCYPDEIEPGLLDDNEHDATEGPLQSHIVNLVANNNGLSIDDILMSFPYESSDIVQEIVEELESAFIIYQKNGRFFAL